MRELINESIDMFICEIKKEKNMCRIEDEILSPLISHIYIKIRPYILGTSIFFIVVILLIICIIILILLPKKGI